MKILFKTQTQHTNELNLCINCSVIFLPHVFVCLFVIILSVDVHYYSLVIRNVCGKNGELSTVGIEKSSKVTTLNMTINFGREFFLNGSIVTFEVFSK